jgi:hypothetical protein
MFDIYSGVNPSNQTQVFERLAYAALAMDLVTVVALDRTPGGLLAAVFVGVILAALIWATARRSNRWTVGGLALWSVYAFGNSLSQHWASAPEWLHSVFPRSASHLVRAEASLSFMLLSNALVIYFVFIAETRTAKA